MTVVTVGTCAFGRSCSRPEPTVCPPDRTERRQRADRHHRHYRHKPAYSRQMGRHARSSPRRDRASLLSVARAILHGRSPHRLPDPRGSRSTVTPARNAGAIRESMAIVVTEQGGVGGATGDQRGQQGGDLPNPAEEFAAHGTASSPRWTRSAAVRDDKSWHPGLAIRCRDNPEAVNRGYRRGRRSPRAPDGLVGRPSTRSATDIARSISSKDRSIALVVRSGTPRGLDDLPRRFPRLSRSQCCDRVVALTS